MTAGTSASQRRWLAPNRTCGRRRWASATSGWRSGRKPVGVVVGAEHRRHVVERPVGAGTPRLGVDLAVGRGGLDAQGRGTHRRTDAAPDRVALEPVRRVPAAVALLAEDPVDRARPPGRHTRSADATEPTLYRQRRRGVRAPTSAEPSTGSSADRRGGSAARRTTREEAAAEEGALERVVAHHPAAAEAVDLARGVETGQRLAGRGEAAAGQVGDQAAEGLAGQDVESYGDQRAVRRVEDLVRVARPGPACRRGRSGAGG